MISLTWTIRGSRPKRFDADESNRAAIAKLAQLLYQHGHRVSCELRTPRGTVSTAGIATPLNHMLRCFAERPEGDLEHYCRDGAEHLPSHHKSGAPCRLLFLNPPLDKIQRPWCSTAMRRHRKPLRWQPIPSLVREQTLPVIQDKCVHLCPAWSWDRFHQWIENLPAWINFEEDGWIGAMQDIGRAAADIDQSVDFGIAIETTTVSMQEQRAELNEMQDAEIAND